MTDGYKWKIVMLGDFAVGKTSLVRRFVYDEFSDSYLTTIGVKVTKKDLSLEKREVSMLLWDIAGSDRFTAISPEYLRGASGGIIVADINRRDSVENIKSHIDMIHSMNSGAGIVIALNKVDLLKKGDDREAYLKSGIFSEKNSGTPEVFFTSARSGENVNELFKSLAELILRGNPDE
ncbi:MAG TPA: Rab family GTPase [Spirochaetota bacterium]|nr:Rab family GTPase [Spirochaetota bacterium]HPJ33216.1 Rab family GTPase [Spirochaetota bacterium]